MSHNIFLLCERCSSPYNLVEQDKFVVELSNERGTCGSFRRQLKMMSIVPYTLRQIVLASKSINIFISKIQYSLYPSFIDLKRIPVRPSILGLVADNSLTMFSRRISRYEIVCFLFLEKQFYFQISTTSKRLRQKSRFLLWN